MVTNTPIHSNTEIFPMVSIFRYNNNTMSITTDPLMVLDCHSLRGKRYAAYWENPIAAEAMTNGA